MAGRKKSLGKKRIAFIIEYLVDYNASRAAAAAGYSARSCHNMGCRLLNMPVVKAEIERREKIRFDKLNIKGERVLEEIAKIAYFDTSKLFKENGELKQPEEWDEETKAAISGLDVEDGSENRARVRKVRTNSKMTALELLGKHLKLFAERVELGSPDGKPLRFRVTMKEEDEAPEEGN